MFLYPILATDFFIASAVGISFMLPSNFQILSIDAYEMSNAPDVICEILIERSTKSNTSRSTFTGFCPELRLISEICVVGIQSEIKFSIRFTSATAKSQYLFPSTVSIATTVISRGLPNIDNFLL